MEKRLTVDLPEEDYKELLKFQLQSLINDGKKTSLGEILKTVVHEWLEKQSVKPINQ